MLCSRFADLLRLPPIRPRGSHPLPPSHSVDRGPVGPSRVSTYATTSKPSRNYPAPAHAANLVRWLRSSGSSHTTSPETTSPAASVCLGKSCPPWPRSDTDSYNTGTTWHEPCLPSSLGDAGIGHLPTT